MTGTARKNESSAATPRLSPRTIPPTIVAAAREVPGTSARVWKSPTANAIPSGTAWMSEIVVLEVRRSVRSTAIRTAP